MAHINGQSRIASVASWSRAIGIGLLATFLFNVVVIFYESLILGGYSTTLAWLAMQFVGLLGTIGLPVMLWFRYKLQAPVAFMSLALLSYVLMPIFGGQGDAPPILFLVVLSPIFVGIYLLVAGLEYLLGSRKKGGSSSV